MRQHDRPVTVIGAGTMGVGVAQCLAAAHHSVIVVDPSPTALQAGPGKIRDGVRLARLLRKDNTLTPTEIASRIRWEPELAGCSPWFVIECAPERIPLKESVFRTLDAVCPADTIFASCTSAIPISLLAAATNRADRVLGMHFMNPAPLKNAVEVIRGPRTSDTTVSTAQELLSTMGKKGIVVADAPGFVSNRVLMLTVNEAATVVQQGTATAETVDSIFKDCFGHPMGPLHTADLIGLDTVLDSLIVLRDCTGDSRFEPCDLLTSLVRAGYHGQKTKRGFHDYTRPPTAARTAS